MSDKRDVFLESLVADLKPVEPLRQQTGMVVALTALALGTVLIVAILGLRHDFASGNPAPLPLTAAGIYPVLALASAWFAVDMARPAVGTRRDGWGWTALMAAVLPGSALALLFANMMSGQGSGLDPRGYYCLEIGSGTGLLTAAALVIWLRRGAPSSPERAGLLTGVAAGAAGIFAVSLWCPHESLLHIGIWHGSTAFVMGLMGRLMLPKLLAW